MKLVNRKQMTQIDALASTRYHIPSLILMEHAGSAVVNHLCQHNYDKDTSFLVVCGNGNNGGDGFVIARLLFQRGYHCEVVMAGNRDHLTKDAAQNLAIIESLSIDVMDALPDAYFDIVIDCLLGTGLSRTIEGHYRDVVEGINAYKRQGSTIISVDIPSGIDSDNGSIHGVAVKADVTYTMQCGKCGMYVNEGRIYSNQIHVLDIAIPQTLIAECESEIELLEKAQMPALLPKRSIHSNKGTYGKLLCIGGSRGMSGAISMAAESALRCGCGLLTCAIPSSIHAIVAQNIWESMSVVLPEEDGFISEDALPILQETIDRMSTILIGCGLGRQKSAEKIVKMLLESEKPLLIDADGLVALKPHLPLCETRKDLIITPHVKEFADLMGVHVKEVAKNCYSLVRSFSERYPGVVLVLKSETTLIATSGKCYVNTYGNNGLAVGGSGDVLAGIIAGLYAQCKNALQAATLGVFLHAYSADLLLEKKSVYSITPQDIIAQVQQTMVLLEKEKRYD